MATPTARERRQSWFSLCLFIASAAYLYQVRSTWIHLVPDWASDITTALTAPLDFLTASHTHLSNHPPSSSVSSSSPAPGNAGTKADSRSVAVAAGTYLTYLTLANAETAKMRSAYDSIGTQYKHYGEKIHYAQKLDNVTRANEANAHLTERIAQQAIDTFGLDGDYVAARTEGSMFRVREAFQHYERDWSAEGKVERDVVFQPILDVLRHEIPLGGRKGVKVLVPGSGLGRLAWEISELGHLEYFPMQTQSSRQTAGAFSAGQSLTAVENEKIAELTPGYTSVANEFSNYMNLALRFLLDSSTTPSPNAHSVHPWAHRFSHQRTNADLFRSVPFPDVTPRLGGRFHILEGDFFTIKPPSTPGFPVGSNAGQQTSGYDYVVTLFFIDTSTNVAANLQKIYDLLRPGGKWINLGPLLWAEGGSVGLQLSLDEVVDLAGMVGFEGIDERRKKVRCEYTADRRGMFQRVYDAQFWVARKPFGA